ncbi:hypothetical protein BDV23DRAFT_152231, partial [Aspergillus alliaceus]
MRWVQHFADLFHVTGVFLPGDMILAWKLEDTIPSSEKAGRQASLSFVGLLSPGFQKKRRRLV